MSPSFLDLLNFNGDDTLEPEMRPERVFLGAQLTGVKLGVRIDAKAKAGQTAAVSPALAAGCTESHRTATSVSGSLGPADTRRFLRFLADSVDNDLPTIDIEVVTDGATTDSVQVAARRLAAAAFA